MAADGSQGGTEDGTGNSPAPMRAGDVLVAASLLTRLPARVDHDRAVERNAAAVWAYPLIGAALGAVGGVALAGLAALGAPAGIAAAAALAGAALLTGAMHEDGLADCADGIGGGWTPERRLEIMKDSRIGAYGTLTLILATLAKWSALAALATSGPVAAISGLAVAGAASRAPLGAIMRWVPNARAVLAPGEAGLSASVGRPPALSAGLGLGLGVIVLPAALWGGVGVGAAVAALFAAGAMAWLARRKLGGQTGDVLGAAQVLAEIAALAALAAAA